MSVRELLEFQLNFERVFYRTNYPLVSEMALGHNKSYKSLEYPLIPLLRQKKLVLFVSLQF